MIEPQKRQAIIALNKAGRRDSEIANILGVDVKTVKRIIKEGAAPQKNFRSDKIIIDEMLLKTLYKNTSGYTTRIHEVLTEEHNITVSYPTLVKRIKELGLGKKSSRRSYQEPDTPGSEMQHDTSPYKIVIGGKKTDVVCSSIYMRYSKIVYIKFYRSFDRFAMKCFFDEALRFWGYCAQKVIIDNTHLAIWYGTGPRAVFTVEMVNFAKHYGFRWVAHEIKHSNRKAGVESFFWHIETNFFPGRNFSSMEDLNRKAFGWATEKIAQKPKSKTHLIPIETFEYEKPYLLKLPAYIPEPYRQHVRVVDQYGYAALRTNYYWVPEYSPDTKEKIKQVKIIEYASRIIIYRFPRLLELVRYELPADGVRNERFAPRGVSLRYKPNNRKRDSQNEEKVLRGMGPQAHNYLDFIISKQCKLAQKHYFIRRLYGLSRKMAPELFLKAMARALEHHVYNIESIAKIATKLMFSDGNTQHMGNIRFDDNYKNRDAYLKGRFCDEHTLDNLNLFDNNDNNNDENDDENGIDTVQV